MTTQVIAELDNLISILESQMPCNVNSPANQRLERRLERELRQYFKSLEDAFPYGQVGQLYSRYVIKETLGRGAWDGIHSTLDPLLALFSESLEVMVNGHLVTIYISKSVEMMTWGKTLGGIPIAYEGPPIEQAISYAEKHCATLVTRMDEETKRRLAQVISEGIQNKRGVPGIATDIKRELGWMGRGRPSAIKGLTMQGRAMMIARTETNDALSQAFMDRAKDMGIEYKEVVNGPAPCDICASNAAEGIVPLNHTFGSGHTRPPFHPNCVCALAPARLGK